MKVINRGSFNLLRASASLVELLLHTLTPPTVVEASRWYDIERQGLGFGNDVEF